MKSVLNEHFVFVGDFTLSSTMAYFNESATADSRVCVSFETVKDEIPEDTESFTYQVTVRNQLDSISPDTISLDILDDDGMKNKYTHLCYHFAMVILFLIATFPVMVPPWFKRV